MSFFHPIHLHSWRNLSRNSKHFKDTPQAKSLISNRIHNEGVFSALCHLMSLQYLLHSFFSLSVCKQTFGALLQGRTQTRDWEQSLASAFPWWERWKFTAWLEKAEWLCAWDYIIFPVLLKGELKAIFVDVIRALCWRIIRHEAGNVTLAPMASLPETPNHKTTQISRHGWPNVKIYEKVMKNYISSLSSLNVLFFWEMEKMLYFWNS